jgi:hypothetical protein
VQDPFSIFFEGSQNNDKDDDDSNAQIDMAIKHDSQLVQKYFKHSFISK